MIENEEFTNTGDMWEYGVIEDDLEFCRNSCNFTNG